MQNTAQGKPGVWLVGDVAHPDFADAVALLSATANIGAGLPEYVVFAESRPGVLPRRIVARLRESAPLAATVALAGSWCEGELRTGRPIAGARRLYWHEFAAWWRRQLASRAAGRCLRWGPEGDFGLRIADCGMRIGRIAIETANWDTATALADVMRAAGNETVWLRPCGKQSQIDGVAAGIWEGGQLNCDELERLATFCRRLAAQGAPAVVLLDFPRRDRVAAARQAGAVAVLGKPWQNAGLLTTLCDVIGAEQRISQAA